MSRPVPIVEKILQRKAGPALFCEEGEISYGLFGGAIAATAQRLVRGGLRPEQRVAVVMSSSLESLVAYLAVQLTGAVAVPLYPHIGAKTLSQITGQTSFAGTFSPPSFTQIRGRRMAVVLDPSATYDYLLPPLSDGADQLFFLGREGKQRSVVRSHENLFTTARMMSRFVGNRSTDRELIAAPLSHPFGLIRLLSVLLTGGAVVLCDGVHRPDHLFELMAKWRATGLSLLTSQWTLLQKLSGEQVGQFATQLRYAEFGGGKLSIEQKVRLMQLLPRSRLCSSYGWPEVGQATYLSFRDAANRLDSEGRAAPGVQLSVRDPSGRPLAAGETGEIWVREGQGGWHPTGEMGRLDLQGYLFVEESAPGVVVVGGWPVSTREVEEVLLTHPSIVEAQVAGAPDPIMGEVVCAKLSGQRLSHDQLFAHVRSQLEPYKVPVRVQWMHIAQPNRVGEEAISSRFS